MLAPLHPTWQSFASRNRAHLFLRDEQKRSPQGLRLNAGSASRRFAVETLNLDLMQGSEVDIQADILELPLRSACVESIVCTGVLEHTKDPSRAVSELYRVLKPGGRAYFEVPFIQTLHASPLDYYRWTPDGLTQLLRPFRILDLRVTAGPASALAWMFQETMAMLLSFHSVLLYKIGLRIFGYLSVPISWMDALLERHPMAQQAASGFGVTALKSHGPAEGE